MCTCGTPPYIVVVSVKERFRNMANYHVTKDKANKQWRVKKEGAERVSEFADTQREAEKIAKEFAANSGGGEVKIHSPRGRDTVAPAPDPFPPRDKKH